MAVHKAIEVDRALITSDDALRKDLELFVLKTAKHHDPHTLYRLQTVPGIGKILSLVLLYEIHHIDRFPSVQDFVSYCRLVTCSKESGGETPGYLRKEHRQRSPHVGLFGSGYTLFAEQSPGPEAFEPFGEKAW